jgi:hypothetical protein
MGGLAFMLGSNIREFWLRSGYRVQMTRFSVVTEAASTGRFSTSEAVDLLPTTNPGREIAFESEWIFRPDTPLTSWPTLPAYRSETEVVTSSRSWRCSSTFPIRRGYLTKPIESCDMGVSS